MRFKRSGFLRFYALVITLLFLFIFIRERYPAIIQHHLASYFKQEKPMENNVRSRRHQLLKLYNTVNNNKEIVMLGNSLTEGVDWGELLGIEGLVNRGIGKDQTTDLLDRIDQIGGPETKIVLIMAGINDLYARRSPEAVAKNLETLCKKLLEKNIQPVLQSTLYVSPLAKRVHSANEQVEQLNSNLRDIANDLKIDFIDLNSYLSANGVLKEVYTYDGVHLNSEGYNAWAAILKPYFKNLGYLPD